jgi:L-2-hydroxyglutarate oxidase
VAATHSAVAFHALRLRDLVQPSQNLAEAVEACLQVLNDLLRQLFVTVCAGLHADRMAAMCGIDLDFRIVPFRGEYFRLPDSNNEIVKHLIYPVPDPKLPFLGVHLTPMIGGYVTVGPNAVLALAREGHRRSAVDLKEVRLRAILGAF